MIEMNILYVLNLFLGCLLTLTVADKLDDYILNYEPLHYNTDMLHQRHLRARRSVKDPSLSLKFKAHGREFDLDLQQSNSVFAPDIHHQFTNGSKSEVDTSFIYEGKVKDEPSSFVHGAIIGGVFRGFIMVPETIFYVEHSRRFFDEKQPFHSVIYQTRHMDLDPYKGLKDMAVGSSCGLDKHIAAMTREANLAQDINKPHDAQRLFEEMEGYHNAYTAEENSGQSHHKMYTGTLKDNKDTMSRQKRATGQAGGFGIKNTCYLFMRSDPILFNYLKTSDVSDIVVKDEILALFSAHVAAINAIYTPTKFQRYDDPSMIYQGVQFQVQRTSIMTSASEKCDNSVLQSSFCNPNIDVSNFLNLNSLTNHEEFCLAYVFTARDFTAGTLGLAWVGAPSNSAGGVCERYKSLRSSDSAPAVKKSLNTGIVTIMNYRKQVAPRVSHLTFAHEVGHNFGSPHDSGPLCAPYPNYPGGSEGNYIMYASATQGDLPHNSVFSPCSLDNITRVLDLVVRGVGKTNCFKESGQAFCGNGLVEEGEECDCGYDDDCTDQCCFPKISGKTTNIECTLKINGNTGMKVQCSPTQGPCCKSTCDFVQPADNQTCRVQTECVDRAKCNGGSASCPSPLIKPNITTLCNDKSQVCEDGMCSGSLCKQIGYESSGVSRWEECFKIPSDPKKTEGLCFLSCKIKNTSTCISSKDTAELDKPENLAFKDLIGSVNDNLPAGSPCNDFKGYCDNFHRCRGIDNDGPLARLKDLIFSAKTLTTIKNWIIEHWWAVLLMAVGLVLLMGLFIKFCAVHTPSSNPKAKPALRITDTLRRRRPNRQQAYQQQQQSQPMQQRGLHSHADPPPPYSASSGGGPKRGHRDKKSNQKV